MTGPGARAFLVVLSFAVVTLSGCFGEEDVPSALPDHTSQEPEPSPGGPLRLVTENGTFVVPHLPGEARDLPDVRRLGQLDHWRTDAGAMRLLTDGQAFVLMVDQSVAPYEGTVFLFVRIYGVEDNDTVAVGTWYSPGLDSPLRVPVAVVPNDIVRMGKAYAYEVVVAAPLGAADCYCAYGTSEQDGLQVGWVENPQGNLHSEPRPRTSIWNATLLDHRVAPLSFRPSWEMAFDGPAEGTDRPDNIENAPLMTPETGTYTFTFTGERVWLVDLLFEFGHSKVHDTRPFARGNGSTSLQLQLDGWQPLDTYRNMSAAKGLEQAFTFEVDVDYETSDGLPGEEGQTFFSTAAIGYRFGGSTYVAGTDGRGVEVRVESAI